VRRGLLAGAALLACLLAAGPAHAKSVRVFAVGPKFSLDWVDTSPHFNAKLVALFDRRRRAGAPLVQRGADDAASHLRGPSDAKRPVQSARDLVVFPEDLGLMAAFVGQRGSGARAVTPETGGLAGAIAALIGSYAPVNAYYASKYPALTRRSLPTRLLALALTDTFARNAVETYAQIADRYDVWLEGGVNMAQSWKVVCVSKAAFKPRPGAPRCDEENAGKVATLRAPDEGSRDYAYEATSANASNMALVFDPDGRLVAKEIKNYLTPTELPGQLDLTPGAISGGDLAALKTPVGTLGFVTSKDAWMPDVVDKLDAQHVDLLVQPEFFVGDTVRTTDDAGRPVMWAPDGLKAAGYSDLLRHPAFESMVLPELSGNVFDFSADAQQHIAVRPRAAGNGRLGLVGQAPAPGFANVGAWLAPDPAGLAFPERRKRLGAAGEAALPKASSPACPDPAVAGPCRGGQVEGVIHRDVVVARAPAREPRLRRKRAATPFGVNRPIAPSRYAQRNVALAASGATVLAAFEERRAGRDLVVLARSTDGGRSFARGRTLGDGWWPSVAVAGKQAWVAWQDASAKRPRLQLARSLDGGRSFGAPVAVAAGSPGAQWRPSLAAAGGRAALEYIGETEKSFDDGLPQAHVFAAQVPATGAVGAGARLDGGTPVTLAAKLDNAWAPSLAARGNRLLASWIDFRTYDWDAYSAESADGGAHWAAEKRVDDMPDTDQVTDGSPDPDEALDDSPAAGLLKSGPLVAFTDYRKRASSSAVPHQLYDVYAAVPGSPNRQVDAHGAAQLDSFSPALAPLPAGGALVAWQDNASGTGDIRIRRVGATGAPAGRARRVEDTAAPVNQYRPKLALAGGQVLAAWEDERDGPAQIFAAVASITSVH
jgi:hypothetical protein